MKHCTWLSRGRDLRGFGREFCLEQELKGAVVAHLHGIIHREGVTSPGKPLEGSRSEIQAVLSGVIDRRQIQ